MAPAKSRKPAGTIDLDVLLAKVDLSPVPVVLKGHTYQVRRDLTGEETVECFRLIDASKDAEALAMLVGEDGEQLNMAFEKLPRQHMVLAVQQFLALAELTTTPAAAAGVEPGESSAS